MGEIFTILSVLHILNVHNQSVTATRLVQYFLYSFLPYCRCYAPCVKLDFIISR